LFVFVQAALDEKWCQQVFHGHCLLVVIDVRDWPREDEVLRAVDMNSFRHLADA